MTNVIDLDEYRKNKLGPSFAAEFQYEDTFTYTLTIGGETYEITVNTDEFFNS